jgi:tetratricopeptide (TPR) repeat protein
MIKTIFISIFLLCLFSITNLRAAESMPSNNQTNTQYTQAKALLKEKKYPEASKILEELLKDFKNTYNADIINDYGFSLRKQKQYDKAEKNYLEALRIDPNHKGANEYLGELYLETQRPELAKKRLEVLKNCNCDEFKLLKANIDRYKPDAPFVPTSSW